MPRPVSQVTITPVPASKLARLERASDFFARYPRLFPKPTSWRVFVQTRRDVLEEEGLIYTLTTGLHVDAQELEQRLGQLLSTPDGRPLPSAAQMDLLGTDKTKARKKLGVSAGATAAR
jgi:hypothetical protein